MSESTLRYFAYGSNMNPQEMYSVCPKSRFTAIARLPECRLDFTRYSQRRGGGVADVVPRSDCEVWGVLYEVSSEDLVELDRKEGVQVGAYRRIQVEVITENDERIQAITYSVVQKSPPVAPASEYLSLILSGARYWCLPEHYIWLLEEHARDLKPPGPCDPSIG